MDSLKKIALAVAGAVGLMFVASGEAFAASLSGVEVNGMKYNVEFSKDKYKNAKEDLQVFTTKAEAEAAADALKQALEATVGQDLLKENGFGKKGDTIYIPYGENKKQTKAFTIRLVEKKDGDVIVKGKKNVNVNQKVTYADFEKVPEPLTLLGSAVAVGAGVAIKRQRARQDQQA